MTGKNFPVKGILYGKFSLFLFKCNFAGKGRFAKGCPFGN